MSELARSALLCGLAVGALGAPCVIVPRRVRQWLGRFPRSRWAGWVLSAVAIVWSGWLLHRAPLGSLESLKVYLPVLVPAVFFLVIGLADELLAPRALGGVLLLIPAPLLSVARWHPSALRLVVIVFAYVLVVEGIVLVLSPYYFRKTMAALAGNDFACRLLGAAHIGLGGLLVLLGLVAY